MGSLVFQATLGGQVNLNGPNTASTFNIAVPATTGTMVTTGDTGSVSSTMLASSLSLVTPALGTPSSGVMTNVTGLPLTTGVTGILPVGNGGTGISTLTTGYIPFGAGTAAFNNSANLFYDSANIRLGVGTSTPGVTAAFVGTDAILLPKGTTAQQPGSSVVGMLRYNTTTNAFEGYSGATPAWAAVGGGGATGGGSDAIFWQNGQTVNTSYTITSSYNAGTFGPVTVASGVTVTVPSGSVWSVV